MVKESAVVAFDDERVVANAGVMLPGRTSIRRHGFRWSTAAFVRKQESASPSTYSCSLSLIPEIVFLMVVPNCPASVATCA
jgi:hypothetical protein